MFNEKEIKDKLNSLAMEALEEMYQDGIDKSFNHVEEIKIYETEGLRRNLKAQISSIKSLMSAARERGDESAVKEYESHLENLRSKRNSVKENTLYTFENGEIVEFVDELSEGVDDYNEKMNSDVEKIRQNNPKATDTFHVKELKRHVDESELPEKDEKGVKYRVMSGYDMVKTYKGDNAREHALAHYHSLVQKEPKGTHAIYRSTAAIDGKITSKPFKAYEKGKHLNEAEKTLWDEKKDKWLEKFTKDQKEKKKDKEVNENKLEQRVNYFNTMKKLPKHLQSGDDGSFEGHIHFKPHNNKQQFSDDILKSKISDAVHTYSDGSFSVHAKNRAKYEKIIRTAHKHGLELNEENEQLDEEIKVGHKVQVQLAGKDHPYNKTWGLANHGTVGRVVKLDKVADGHVATLETKGTKYKGAPKSLKVHTKYLKNIFKEEEQLDEAVRHFVYKHWPDLHQFVQVGKKGGYASKEEAQKHADKFNANKDKYEVAHHYTVKSIGVVKEDEEQLNEISKKTLGSYIKKASAEVSSHSYDSAKEMHNALNNSESRQARKFYLDKSDSHADKSGKRQKGIHKAVDKLTKESTKLDEVAPKNPKIEKWIKDNKQRFIDQYGEKKGKEILYAKAWKMNEESDGKTWYIKNTHQEGHVETFSKKFPKHMTADDVKSSVKKELEDEGNKVKSINVSDEKAFK